MGARDGDFVPVPARRTYAHYPRYPQVDSPWFDSDSMTASNRGRDDPPATEVSLPSHSPGGCLAPSSDRWPAEADGRAADEAAAMRTRTGLPFSGCGGGRLRKAPIRNRLSFGTVATGSGPRVFGPHGPDRQDTGFHDPGPARQKAVSSDQRTATGPEGASAPERPGRTGLRPGSCETGMAPAFRRMTMSGGTEASAEDPAGRGFRGFGP